MVATVERSRLTLDTTLRFSDRAAVRPEPFGALLYHFDNRRLSFLRHPDMLEVVRALDGERSIRDVLAGLGIEDRRVGAFVRGLQTLADSEMVLVVGDARPSTGEDLR